MNRHQNDDDFRRPRLLLAACILALTPSNVWCFDKAQVIERFTIPSDNDELALPVTVKGRAHLFVLDTGCGLTVCDTSLVPVLGAPVGRARAKTANGTVTSPVFPCTGMAVGRTAFRDELVMITADLSTIRRRADRDIRGYLGMDFLADHIVSLDFDSSELLFLRSVDDSLGTPFPLTLNERKQPGISMSIGGNGDQPVDFFIDTGYTGLGSGALCKAVFNNLANRRFLSVRGSAPLATPSGMSSARFGLLLGPIGTGRFEHRGLSFDEIGDYNALGLGYWRRFRVTFDFPRQTVYLAPGRRFNLPDLRDMSGLHLWRVDGKARVYSVDAGSPSDSAGIRAGDWLLRLDHADASRVRLYELREILCAEGSRVAAVIRRGEETQTIYIDLRDWWAGQAAPAACEGAKEGHERPQQR